MTTSDAAPKPAPKVFAPPPFPLLHTHVTVDQFSTPFPSGPWSFNVSAPSIAPTNNNFSTIATSIRGAYIKVWYKMACPAFPEGFSVGFETTKDAKTIDVNPSVYYKFRKEGDNVIGFSLKTGRLSHTWTDAKGTFTTDVNTNVRDYLCTDGCVNSRLYPGLLGGFEFVFDPTRSGLKNYRVGLKYKMTHAVSCDGTGTFAVSTLRSLIPGRLQVSTLLKASRKGYEATVGGAAFSPCGAKVSAKLAIHDGAAAVGVSRMIGGTYRVNIGAHGNVYKKTYGGIGVSFSYEQ